MFFNGILQDTNVPLRGGFFDHQQVNAPVFGTIERGAQRVQSRRAIGDRARLSGLDFARVGQKLWPLGRAVDEIGHHVQLIAESAVVVLGADVDDDGFGRQTDDEFDVAQPHLLLLPLGLRLGQHGLGVYAEADVGRHDFGGALVAVVDGDRGQIAFVNRFAGRVQRQAADRHVGYNRRRREFVQRPPKQKPLVKEVGGAHGEEGDEEDAAKYL